MVAMSVDSERVRELEAELDGIRNAFQDFIANSRNLENGVGQQLGNMRRKLEYCFAWYPSADCAPFPLSFRPPATLQYISKSKICFPASVHGTNNSKS
eukprot:scaffold982_cov139-Cylindrotheca_fusiformis.AAC.17